MKITQITAHLVESTEHKEPYNNVVGPYWRIEDSATITWLCGLDQDDARPVYGGKLRKALEQEFQETNGIIHEQLKLFNE